MTEGVVDITGFVKLQRYIEKQEQVRTLVQVKLLLYQQSMHQKQNSRKHLKIKSTNNSEVLTYEELHSRLWDIFG